MPEESDMALMRFSAGLEVRIGAEVHRFVDSGTDAGGRQGWILKNVGSGDARLFSRVELAALFESGALKAHHTDGEVVAAQREAARRRRVRATDDLPPADARRRRARAEFLRQVREMVGTSGMHATVHGGTGGPTTMLKRALREVSQHTGEELRLRKNADGSFVPPSQATYYRWAALAPDPEDLRRLQGDFCARGRRNRIHPIVRETVLSVMRDALALARDKKAVGRTPVLKMGIMRDDIDRALSSERAMRPELAPSLAMPSLPTLHRIYGEFPAFDRAVAKHGLSKARRDFRFVRGHERPTGAYELVEYDETRMPFFFIDERHGIPLGNGTLCAAVDVASGALGGVHVSFEPFSDLTMMSTLRHACSLKSYVGTMYPGINNPWHQGGMFQCIGIDNSKQAWGKTLREVSSTLDCDKIWLPPRTPWFKPLVEGFFRLLNDMLLNELPGFNLWGKFDRTDYDPAKNACIGLRTFLYIFHKWLLDLHHVRAVEARGNMSPNQLWELARSVSDPGLLDSHDDLESLFGVVRVGSIDHRGLLFENMRYRSEELRDLRITSGARKQIRFKINPSNLLHVRFWHPVAKAWMTAVAADEAYADGLSLHVHKLVRKHTREKNREENAENHRVGLTELRAMIAATAPQALTSATGAAVARFIGAGTQNLFAGMDHLGAFNPAPGLLLPAHRLSLSADTVHLTSPDGTAAADPAPGPATGDAGSGMPLPQASRRPVRAFKADDSLRRA